MIIRSDTAQINEQLDQGQCHTVSTDWLHENLDHPQLVIVDCRFSLANPALGRQQYEAGHLPGAHFLDLNLDLSGPIQTHGGRHPLPEPTKLSETLTAIGVRSANGQPPSWVIAYDDSRLAYAARLWWLLRYLGHDQVAVLDGGFTDWQHKGYPVTDALPQPRAGNFLPHLRSNWVVDIETVKNHQGLPGVVVVDSRESERYRGEQEPIDPVAGHIPGAVNYPWQSVTDSAGHLLPVSEQQQRWATLPLCDEVIVYCGSGVTACVNLLSLALAGIQHGKLYAGSWSDWCSYLEPSEPSNLTASLDH